MYLLMYPERQQPHHPLFKALDKNLDILDYFKKCKSKYRDRMGKETKENLLNDINMNPEKSTQVSQNISTHKSVWRQLRKCGLKPFKIHLAEKLHPGGVERRLVFCNWLAQKITDKPHFVENIIWTDKSTFRTCGVFKRQKELMNITNNKSYIKKQ